MKAVLVLLMMVGLAQATYVIVNFYEGDVPLPINETTNNTINYTIPALNESGSEAITPIYLFHNELIDGSLCNAMDYVYADSTHGSKPVLNLTSCLLRKGAMSDMAMNATIASVRYEADMWKTRYENESAYWENRSCDKIGTALGAAQDYVWGIVGLGLILAAVLIYKYYGSGGAGSTVQTISKPTSENETELERIRRIFGGG